MCYTAHYDNRPKIDTNIKRRLILNETRKEPFVKITDYCYKFYLIGISSYIYLKRFCILNFIRKVMFMIDIHSHILPGVDDGAQTERDSIAMANEAVKQGIHTIIATPHHKNGSFDNIRDIIITQVNVLNDLFKQEDIP